MSEKSKNVILICIVLFSTVLGIHLMYGSTNAQAHTKHTKHTKHIVKHIITPIIWSGSGVSVGETTFTTYAPFTIHVWQSCNTPTDVFINNQDNPFTMGFDKTWSEPAGNYYINVINLCPYTQLVISY